jgi:uncharacterized protein (TIGR02646 family)
MIPVTLQPEPVAPEFDFDTKVRKPGQKWLTKHQIPFHAPPPKGTKLRPYWSESNKPLWHAYSGQCAYLAIYFEWATGASSTDHFVAKSKHAGDAYEWNNYRLACLGPNRLKNNFADVLDPVGLAPDTFVLNLFSGRMRPNPALSPADFAAATATIDRLQLNCEETKRMRARHFSEYLKNKDRERLQKYSPFVWYEAQQQGLL